MQSIYFKLFLILLFTIFVSLALGKYPISFEQMLNYLYSLLISNSLDESLQMIDNIIMEIRLPRVIAAILIGASYAVSGASFQAMFINPLVSPGILGVLSGSAFGAALAIAFFDSWFLTQLFSFSFGILAVIFAIFVTMIYQNRANNSLILILGGIISGSAFSTLLSIVKFTADPYEKLPSIVYWLMGSLSYIELNQIIVVFFPMLFGILTLIMVSKYLNILSFSEEEAKSMGVNTKLIRTIVIIVATFISAISVCLAGMIGWIGLIIPHFARLLVGANNQVLLPTCAFLGAIFLLIVDNFSRMILEFEVPIGILTSVIGIPIFIFVLKSSKKALQ
ncbi:ABC transporter permease [Malaciobacter halophilus]|uniref:ABC transporter permease n=1 Tax=Malaciobacter halophilus TaxID=197482 RepID=A0A2N1J4F2_9BACT|nr:iron ABC transporter permease [Malaciobacter halophilus]AXH09399.1 iron siderophore ABC transporter, permease protein [Malaciobacter halophilus]PKI81448.1 ABC transporter permease [Malaciobacter halophilus]